MLRFDYKKIQEKCGYEPLSICRAFCHVLDIKFPGMSKKDHTNFVIGDSYLVDASSLFRDNLSSIEEKIQYIELASMRNFANYRLARDTTLLTYFVDTETLNNNTLLTIKDNRIHFKFEEIEKWQ